MWRGHGGPSEGGREKEPGRTQQVVVRLSSTQPDRVGRLARGEKVASGGISPSSAPSAVSQE